MVSFSSWIQKWKESSICIPQLRKRKKKSFVKLEDSRSGREEKIEKYPAAPGKEPSTLREVLTSFTADEGVAVSVCLSDEF